MDGNRSPLHRHYYGLSYEDLHIQHHHRHNFKTTITITITVHFHDYIIITLQSSNTIGRPMTIKEDRLPQDYTFPLSHDMDLNTVLLHSTIEAGRGVETMSTIHVYDSDTQLHDI